MSYRVIKKVKGRFYLYEQESFRAGGKVCTRSRYLGPVAAGDGEPQEENADQPRVSEALPESRQKGETPSLAPPLPHEPPQSQVVRLWATPPRGVAPNLVITTKMRLADHGISGPALEKEYEQAASRLKQAGLPVEELPPIAVGRGLKTNRRRRWRGGYVVTLARFGQGHRTKFKKQFSRALADASLDLLEKHRPDEFAELKKTWKKSFERSQKALGLYVRAATRGSRSGTALSYSIRFFGRFSARARRLLPKARQVGLVDFSERKNWREDASVLLGRVQRVGFNRARNDVEKELAAARKERAIATNMAKQKKRKVEEYTWRGKKTKEKRVLPWSRYRRMAQVRRRKAIARLAAVEEMQVKIDLLGSSICRQL